jgi:uncharacterized protein YcfL
MGVMKHLACSGAALLAAVAIAGCASTSGIEATGKTTWSDEGARELAQHVIFNSRSLAGDLQIVDLQSDRAGDLMRAQVSLRSKDRDTVKAQYRFEWYDLQGMEINANSAWKPLMLYGRETATVKGVAPDTRAKTFKLKVREPDK